MAAHADNLHEHAVAGGHEGAAAHGELALRQARVVVHGIDGIAGKALEQAFLHHGLGTAVEAALLGRLEDQVQAAAEVAVARQILGRAQQHGHMAVMAAGMHAARDAAGMLGARGLLNRQCIHVGANAQAAAAIAVAQRADQACAAYAARDLVTPFGELARDEVGGAVLGKRQFRVLVQMAANGDQLLLVGQELGDTGKACRSRGGGGHSRTMLLALAMRV